MKIYRIVILLVMIFILSGCDQLLEEKENQDPVVTGTQNLELDLGSTEPDWKQYIEVTDEEDGIIRVTEDMIESFVNFDLEGVYEVNYYITDSDGKTIKYTIQVEIIDNRSSNFSLLGDSTIYIDVDSEYVEPGVVSEYDDGNIFNYETSTDLDTSCVGEYTIDYIFREENIIISRTVVVEDNISPTFTFDVDDEIYLELNSDYIEPLLLINDNYYEDGFLTVKQGDADMETVGTYTVGYSVDDPSGNSSLSKDYTVNVVDYSLISFIVTETDIEHYNNIEYLDLGLDLVNEFGDTIRVFSSDSISLGVIGVQVLSYVYIDFNGVQYETSINVNVNDIGPPTQITIMHGAVYMIDPFHEAYSGTDQLAKQELQRAVELALNVEIIYVNYSASAAWGPSRVTAIIQSSVSGDHLSDIYWVTSDWLQQLVEGEAIANVSAYMSTHGTNIDESYCEVGTYQNGIYGFGDGEVQIKYGLYYNADLIESLGVANPTELYLNGEWNWAKFEVWATEVQTMLSAQGDDMFALGGMLSAYAQNMIPLNGGSLINADTGRVAFAQNPALATYDFLGNLYNKGLFEPSPQYDAGSPEWMAGKVAMHPGELWFLTASNRWGSLPFELGFVPFPVADDFTGEYISPVNGVALLVMATGMSPEKEELVFQVWNEIQLWKTDEELASDYELILLTKFDESIYVEAYLEIYDKIYFDLIAAMSISAFAADSWNININSGIREGTSRTVVDQIKPIYEAALDDYLGE